MFWEFLEKILFYDEWMMVCVCYEILCEWEMKGLLLIVEVQLEYNWINDVVFCLFDKVE